MTEDEKEFLEETFPNWFLSEAEEEKRRGAFLQQEMQEFLGQDSEFPDILEP